MVGGLLLWEGYHRVVYGRRGEGCGWLGKIMVRIRGEGKRWR